MNPEHIILYHRQSVSVPFNLGDYSEIPVITAIRIAIVLDSSFSDISAYKLVATVNGVETECDLTAVHHSRTEDFSDTSDIYCLLKSREVVPQVNTVTFSFSKGKLLINSHLSFYRR